MAKKPPPPLPPYVEDALGAELPPRKEITSETRKAYQLCVDLARTVARTETETAGERRVVDLIADTIESWMRRMN